MKQILNNTLLYAATAVLLLAGCSKEPSAEAPGEGVRICLNIDGQALPSSKAPASRAVAVNESAVANLWVLQFKMNAGSTTDGHLVAKSYISSVSNPTNINVKTEPGSNMMLYLVANGSASLFSATLDGTVLSYVKKIVQNVTTTTGEAFPTGSDLNLPMTGQSTVLTLPTYAAVPVTLKRSAAKVMLTVRNILATGYPQLTVTSVQLKNIPRTYMAQCIDLANGFDGSTDLRRYPAGTPSNFTDYTALTGNINAGGIIATYYMAPNVRGRGSNSDPYLKSDATAPAGQGAYCTYVEILGTAKASATVPAADVRYRLYLGGNNMNDFNLLANTVYKVGITFVSTINGIDARVTIATDQFELVEGPTDGNDSGNSGDEWNQVPAVGKYYYSDGTFSTRLWSGKTATGMIFWVDPSDPTKFKVMSLEEAAAKLEWSKNRDYIVGTDDVGIYGRAHTAAIKASWDAKWANIAITESSFDAAFPAAAYCYNYTGRAGADAPGTWYLPAKNELQYLWCAYNGVAPITWSSGTSTSAPASAAAQAAWNARIQGAGVAKGITNDSHWSSIEDFNNTQGVYLVKFLNGNTNPTYKDYTLAVRCIRDVTPLPAVGDYYYSDRSFSTELLRDKTPVGMVFRADPADPTKFKVMSLLEKKFSWAAKDTYVIGNSARDLNDGRANTAAIKAYYEANKGNLISQSSFDAAFLAAAYCYNYTGRAGIDAPGTWYLPARNESLYLCHAFNGLPPDTGSIVANTLAQDAWNARITAIGSERVVIGSTSYFWSSTEHAGMTGTAYCVYANDSSLRNYNKETYFLSTRCVRDL